MKITRFQLLVHLKMNQENQTGWTILNEFQVLAHALKPNAQHINVVYEENQISGQMNEAERWCPLYDILQIIFLINYLGKQSKKIENNSKQCFRRITRDLTSHCELLASNSRSALRGPLHARNITCFKKLSLCNLPSTLTENKRYV